MTTLLGAVVVAIVVGFIWLVARDVKESKAAVTHLREIKGLKVDADFNCTPTGNLLFDFSARKLGLANVSFPTHSTQNPPSFNASTIIAFQDISKTSTYLAPEGTMLHVHFSLAKRNLINSDTYVTVYVHVHDKNDIERLNKALAHAGLSPEQPQGA